jgi:hypothetical protein
MWNITKRLYKNSQLYTLTWDESSPAKDMNVLQHKTDTTPVPVEIICNGRVEWEKNRSIHILKEMMGSTIPMSIGTFNRISDDIELISNSHVKVKDQILALSNVSLQDRQKIWSLLYTNVYDFSDNITLSFPEKNVFFIPSFICPSENPLNILSSEERLEMTIEQCTSIRNNSPNNIIILMDSSHLSFYHLEKLHKHVDLLILFETDKISNNLSSSNKSLGETYVLYKCFSRLFSFKTFIKLGNRYKLLSKFDVDNFPKDKTSWHCTPQQFTWSKHGALDTVCYIVPFSCRETLSNFYNHIMTQGLFIDIEHSSYQYFCPNNNTSNINIITPVNAVGYSAAALYNLV